MNETVSNTSKYQNERIFYINFFDPRNSNLHWKRAFESYTTVMAYDFVKEPGREFWPKLSSFHPTHIHLGGSVKGDVIPVGLLLQAKRKFGCVISQFYGDALFPSYCFRMAAIAERVYFSNQSFPEWGRLCERNNMEYMPCPTDLELFRPVDVPKTYDVIFIGNNNDPSRLEILKNIHRQFDLTVFGAEWESTGLKAGGPVYDVDFSKTISSSKVVLSLLGDRWMGWKSYFSNRLMNSLACGGCVVQTYTEGLEEVFEKENHLLWYRTQDEFLQCVDRLLQDDALRERMSDGARQAVEPYSYGNTVLRILKMAERERSRNAKEFASSKKTMVLTGSNVANQTVYASPGMRWRDETNLIVAPQSELRIERSQIPDDLIDRLEFWRECRRTLPPDAAIDIAKPQGEDANDRNELFPFGFVPDPHAPEPYWSRYRRPDRPASQLDRWFEQLIDANQPRYGRAANPLLTVEWCRIHPLTHYVSRLDLKGKNVLFVFSGTGEWPFVILQNQPCEMIGMEVSWIAVDNAVDSYGCSALRFLPYTLPLFPTDYFDAILFFSPAERMANWKTLMPELKRTLMKPGSLVMGIYAIQSATHPFLQDTMWFERAFPQMEIADVQQTPEALGFRIIL